MKKIITSFIASSLMVGLQTQAQTLIDAFNGESLSAYTTTLVLDNSSGAGSGVSFTDGSGSLVASFAGATSDPEQALFLNATALPAGDVLLLSTAVPASATLEDLGLAISATSTPTAAASGNAYNSRGAFDWASVSIRPSQTSIRVNTSVNGTVTTSASSVGGITPANVSALYIENQGNNIFTLGYVYNGVVDTAGTQTWSLSSTIGAAIGIYGDLRTTGTSLGNVSNLTIEPIADFVPEPASMALFGIGGLALVGALRRK